MPTEKRKLQRRHTIYYLPVFDRNSGAELGRLVDITTEGLMIVRETPLARGLTLPLRLALPSPIGGENEINFTAQSVWCRKDKNPDLYGVGFKFTETPDPNRDLVESLIAFLGFQD